MNKRRRQATFGLLHKYLCKTEKKSVYVRYNCNPSTDNPKKYNLIMENTIVTVKIRVVIQSTIVTPKVEL